MNEDISADIVEDNDVLGNDLSFDPFSDNVTSSPLDKHKDLLRQLTNFDPIIQRKIRNWLGLEWDDEVKDYTQKQPAIINERGARWAIGVLQTYQSQTNFITNITQGEFKNLQHEIIDLVWLVFPTIDEFAVKTNAHWYRLCQELQHSAFLVLAGAGDGKYTKFLGESVTRQETVNLSPPSMGSSGPNKQGWLSNVKNKLLGRG